MAVLHPWSGAGSAGYFIFCPGCDSPHMITTSRPDGSGWQFDGNEQSPTFSPSLLLTYTGRDAGQGDAPPARCHSFIRAGMIEFLSDCTHQLAGQTVPLPDYPKEWE